MPHNDSALMNDNSRSFKEAFNRQDSAGLAELYSPDAKLIPPYIPMIVGREGIKKYWDGAFIDRGTRTLTSTPIENVALGDTIIETNSMKVGLANGGQLIGTYLLVWKRQPDGRWKIVTDIWNFER